MTNSDRRTNLRIGEVYLMHFEGTGNEQNGWRPGVIIQNNVGNKYSPNIIAVPLTSALKKKRQPTHVFIRAEDSGLPKDSLVLCENPKTISKDKVGSFITELPLVYMREVAVAFLYATSTISFLTKEALLSAWEKAIKLNEVA